MIPLSIGDLVYAVKAHRKENFEVIDTINFAAYAVNMLPYSQSQILQDLWVLYESEPDSSRFFVDFGASDGRDSNNTWLLKEQGWKGICAEPNPVWQERLFENRHNDSWICNLAVADVSEKRIQFLMPDQFPELATEDKFVNSDYNAQKRIMGGAKTIEVETISLNDLLEQSNAPRDIDYISVDTEGSELEILSTFDFNHWNVKMFTIEHNFGPNRSAIRELMTSKGYKIKFEQFSRWDDWFIR